VAEKCINGGGRGPAGGEGEKKKREEKGISLTSGLHMSAGSYQHFCPAQHAAWLKLLCKTS
jgi:hypothetical protein